MSRIISFILCILVLPLSTASADVILNINQTTQTLEWENGNTITQITAVANNSFGTFVTADTIITSPLLAFADPVIPANDHTGLGFRFDFSPGGTAIDGVALGTTDAPSLSSTFAGTAAPPTTPTFIIGNFSGIANLTPGTFTYTPVASNWDGNIVINITTGFAPKPVPTMSFWGLAILASVLGLIGVRRRMK